MEYTRSLNKLIDALHRLPGIGPKMAERLALYILKIPHTEVNYISDALMEVKEKVRHCKECGSITEDEVCWICTDVQRNIGCICIVEQSNDVWAVERSREYKGLYHVLGGALSPLDEIGPNELRIKELLQRLKNREIIEVIIATNPTVEGEATAMYITKLIRPFVKKITRIAHGVPVGSDLEYTDSVTIARALEGRKEL